MKRGQRVKLYMHIYMYKTARYINLNLASSPSRLPKDPLSSGTDILGVVSSMFAWIYIGLSRECWFRKAFAPQAFHSHFGYERKYIKIYVFSGINFSSIYSHSFIKLIDRVYFFHSEKINLFVERSLKIKFLALAREKKTPCDYVDGIAGI